MWCCTLFSLFFSWGLSLILIVEVRDGQVWSYGGNFMGLLPSMAETFRTHDWSLLLKYTVPSSSMGNTLEFVDDEEKPGGWALKPISISNKDLQLPSFLKDRNISSKGLLPSMAETFRTHDWPLLLNYTVPFSSMGNTPEFVDDEEIAGGRRLKPIYISDKDLRLPNFLNEWDISSKIETLLPSMAETFKTKDWSLLRKFSSMDSNLNIEDALKSELAAICVWFLFTKVPPRVKEGVARTLTFISFGTSKVTKMSFDQTGVENLVLRILRSGNTEAQSQVCLALSVLASFPSRRLDVTLSAGIQDQLLQLVCNLSCNPELTYPVVSAVASVSLSTKGMREKIVKTELLDSWLVKFLSRKDDESIMADACRTVEGIACERCDCELWDHVKEKLLPPIVDGLFNTTSNVRLLGAAICAILKITEYGSSDQIDDLVEVGGLEFLFYACFVEDGDLLRHCFVAIENILRAGEAKADKAKAKADKDEDGDKDEDKFEDEDEVENEYAMMIDGYRMGWDIICMYSNDRTYGVLIVHEARELLGNYGPPPLPWLYKRSNSELLV